MGGQALEYMANVLTAPVGPLMAAGMPMEVAGLTTLGVEAGAGIAAANLAFPSPRGSSAPVGGAAQAQAAARAAATDSTSSGFTAPTSGGGGSRYDTASQTVSYDARPASRQREADELALVQAEYARRAQERAQRQAYG